MDKSKFIRTSIITIFILSLLAITTFAVTNATPLASKQTETTSSNGNMKVSPNFKPAGESDKLALYVDEETLNIQVKNKKTGFVWATADTSKAKKMNNEYIKTANSGIIIGYKSKGSTEKERRLPSMGNAKVKMNYNSNGFSANVNFRKLKLELTLNVTIKDDRINVSIPYDSVVEESEEYLTYYISLYPFFGSSQNQVDGEFFIPDGMGATIDLSKPTNATKPFSAKYYGDDIGFLGELGLKKYAENSTPPRLLSVPVFGISSGKKNACLAYIEKGAPYAELDAYLSGIITDFNYMYSTFFYRGDYTQQYSKKGAGVAKNQEDKNKFDISQTYLLIDGEDVDYSDMAVRLRDELKAQKILTDLKDDSTTLGVNYFMADNESGMLGNNTLVATTAKFAKDSLKELTEEGIKNISSSYTGYSKSGLTNSYPSHLGFEMKTGSAGDYKELFEFAKKQGIDTYLTADFVKAYAGAAGYAKKDIARTMAGQFVSVGGDHFDKFNILSPNKSKTLFENQLDDFKKTGVSGINMQSIGNILYSSYIDDAKSRDETIQLYNKILELNSLKTSLSNPNLYAWQYASQMTDIPLTSSEYIICTKSVPFMQIVLKGSVKLFTIPLNLNQRGKVDILNMIDYGMNPSYTITKEDPSMLYRTDSKTIFTSEYSLWKEDMKKTYDEISAVLNKVNGAFITSRKEIAEDIIAVTYSNDKIITLNYSDTEYVNNDLKIPAMSYSIN